MQQNDDAEFLQVRHPLAAVPYKKFAEMIGRSESAVKAMVENGKLPVVYWQNPEGTKASKRDNWIYLPAFNEAMREAFMNRPKEQRDAWLLWIGL